MNDTEKIIRLVCFKDNQKAKDLLVKDTKYMTILYHAIEHNNTEIIDFILNNYDVDKTLYNLWSQYFSSRNVSIEEKYPEKLNKE